MNRLESIALIEDVSIVWDIIIIGGGATGLGCAVDAASRGFKTLLVEQADFGKGTSSRSTKLIHGGVRYLEQGNISLVLESLKERGLLKRNAPHLVKNLEFVVPIYHWWEALYYGIGLKLYDLLAGNLRLGSSKFLSKTETLKRIPTIKATRLKGAVLYYDGQFDDARLLISLAQTATEKGATIANYVKVNSLVKHNNKIAGVEVCDQETNKTYKLKSKVVINATGVFTDTIRQIDDLKITPIMTSSQGVHIVLDQSFLPGHTAMMLPKTDDGRIFFIIPWQDKIIVGTTDTPVKEFLLEPKAEKKEIEFLLNHTARYLTRKPELKDIKSVFVGLRPLVKAKGTKNTSKLSREHRVVLSQSGLVSITGGKWTTYRKMAEDAIDKAIEYGDLEKKQSATQHLNIYNYYNDFNIFLEDNINYGSKLHPDYNFIEADVIWAVRYDMARTLEDVLARRIRLLFLDVDAALQIAPRVVQIMAQELGQNKTWQQKQLTQISQLVKNYQVNL